MEVIACLYKNNWSHSLTGAKVYKRSLLHFYCFYDFFFPQNVLEGLFGSFLNGITTEFLNMKTTHTYHAVISQCSQFKTTLCLFIPFQLLSSANLPLEAFRKQFWATLSFFKNGAKLHNFCLKMALRNRV